LDETRPGASTGMFPFSKRCARGKTQEFRQICRAYFLALPTVRARFG
jgi:hypothetical protein